MGDLLSFIESKYKYSDVDLGLVYIADSGRGGRYKSGTKAGHVDKSGNVIISISGFGNKVESGLVWLIHHRKMPKGKLIHKNGNPSDNRISNLYEKPPKGEISKEILLSAFSYNPELGKIFWKIKASRAVKVGAEAGWINDDGYRIVGLFGVEYRVHRLIWMLENGSMPDKGLEIDHINGIRNDNKISNLRVVNRSGNSQNQFVRADSKTGVKGVRLRKDTGKYVASIQADGKIYTLINTHSLEEAIEARRKAEIELHPFRKQTLPK